MTSTHDRVENNARYFALGRISTLFGPRGPLGADWLDCPPREALDRVYEALSDVMLDSENLTEDDIATVLESVTFQLKRQFGGQRDPGFVVPLGSSTSRNSRLTAVQEEALAALRNAGFDL